MRTKTITKIATFAILTAILAVPLRPSLGMTPTVGAVYYNGVIFHVLTPPSKTDVGLDNIYPFTNGVSGQLAVSAVAPGNPNYHGGHWIVNLVTFKSGVTPVLLTSEAAILSAESAGQVTIQRNVTTFLCPLQP
jgi:hypothetical protein